MNEKIKLLQEELEKIEKQSQTVNLEWQFAETLKRYNGEDQVISFNKFKELNKDIKNEGFSSGIGKLDEMIDGFHKGDLITITGETGQGKTSFSQFLTSSFSKEKIKSLWFSYEVPAMNFIMKFGDDIPDGYLPQILLERNLIWIERKIVEGIAKFNIQVVFIDHLHYLFNLMTSKNVSLEIGDIMRNLKIISKKYNITIFIMAHTGKSRDDGSVGLDNIRDSSFVAQESDTVIAIWRNRKKQSLEDRQENGIKYDENKTTISIAKNRFTGRIGSVKVGYNINNNSFAQLI